MAPNKTVKTSIKNLDGYKVELKARDHVLYIDQPPAGGGKDEGPTPLEYLFFALGGCVATVGKIIAMQQRIDLRGIEVEVEGDLNLEVLMGKSTEDRSGFSDIRVTVKVDADMTQAEKEKFVEAIDARCPISDNILNSTPVSFVVK